MCSYIGLRVCTCVDGASRSATSVSLPRVFDGTGISTTFAKGAGALSWTAGTVTTESR